MRRYSADEKAFLRFFIPGHSHRDITEAFNERFPDITVAQVKAFIKNNGLTTGRTGRFEAGHVPANKGKSWDEFMAVASQEACRKTLFKPGHSTNIRPIGYEVWRGDGYLWRKVAFTKPPRHGWRQVHRILWEEANGAVPADMTVSFIDGDATNIVLENLTLVPRALRSTMNHLGLTGASEEVMLTARIVQATKARRKAGR
ncbi:MAG: HNH endonuclease [Coriobacteriia bacterium]|nr:HNH endonuclease [Coriobacteriia bacterium]